MVYLVHYSFLGLKKPINLSKHDALKNSNIINKINNLPHSRTFWQCVVNYFKPACAHYCLRNIHFSASLANLGSNILQKYLVINNVTDL